MTLRLPEARVRESMLAVTIKPALAEAFYVQGWRLSVWRSFPHRAYSLLAWRTL